MSHTYRRNTQGELEAAAPFKADEEQWVKAKLKTIIACTVFVVAATSWALDQSFTIRRHSERFDEVTKMVGDLVGTVQGDHEQLRSIQSEQRIQSMKLDFLTGARRDRPPATVSTP